VKVIKAFETSVKKNYFLFHFVIAFL